MAQQRYNYILSHGEQSAAQRQPAPTQKRQGKRPPQKSGQRVQQRPSPEQGGQQMQARKPKRKEPGLRIYDGNLDMVFFVIIVVLLVYGVIMMFSASYVAGLNLRHPDGYHYVRTQGVAAIAGVFMMIFMSFWDYHILMNRSVALGGFALATLLMLAVWTPLGHAEYDARRWIYLGTQSLQPSEVMKAVLIVFLAYLVVKNEKRLHSFKQGVIPLIFILGFVSINMIAQRHISGLVLICTISLCVIFVGGMPLRQFVQLTGILFVLALIGAVAYSMLKGGGLSYIFDRFAGMSQADSGELTDESWQITQSLIAIGSGGWFGLGFGESRQKYAWLPESQNDFVLPIVIEELGFLGGIVVVILFGLFIYRGFYIAKKAPDKFGMLIAAGITFQIGLQALLNIGVACNAIPNTGISLPFFSYGGTALLIQLAEMGVVLSVSRQCEI